MSESVNKGSRMDQIEATMAKMVEHLLTLTANMSNNAAPGLREVLKMKGERNHRVV